MATNKTINGITRKTDPLSNEDLFVIWNNGESNTRSTTVENLLNTIKANLLNGYEFDNIQNSEGQSITDIGEVINYLYNQVKNGAKVGSDPDSGDTLLQGSSTDDNNEEDEGSLYESYDNMEEP